MLPEYVYFLTFILFICPMDVIGAHLAQDIG